MNARRIRRPSAVRIGMFCRLGSCEDSRPVAAITWLKVVWMRPWSSTIGISESTTVFSRDTSRCRSRWPSSGTSGTCSDNHSSASASVV